jgi:hypothetical protein
MLHLDIDKIHTTNSEEEMFSAAGNYFTNKQKELP